MTTQAPHRIGDVLLMMAAGLSSFLLSLGGLLFLTEANEKIVAAVAMGVFALLVCWIAAERPNGRSARASAALVDRLLRVESGDLVSPTPRLVHECLPTVGKAVDHLFTQVRASIDNANAVAFYDPVTGLPNRVHFRQEAERLLSSRTTGKLTAMMFVDLDRFKAVNDSLGHARGDEALTLVADRLRLVAKEAARDARGLALVARLAGDEFTLLFPELDDAAQASRIARSALAALSQPFDLGGESVDIGASIGVALCPRHGRDVTSLMRASDLAMYQAKSSGRGQVCVFDDSMARDHQCRVTTQRELRAALANDEFEFHFQPRHAYASGEVAAIEAVLRWNHPRDGLRRPESFIPVAESCGLIVDVGEWAARSIAGTLVAWPETHHAARLVISLTSRQLGRSRFLVTLRDEMARSGADPACLELEFGEAVCTAMSLQDLADLAQLRESGVVTSLGDFGEGNSNVARLKEIPLDRIKIGSSLTCDIVGSEGAQIIVQAVVQLIRGLGCVSVADGVESDEQAEMLRLIGCDVLQGRPDGAPMTADELVAWMAVRAPAPAGQLPGSMPTITAA